LKLAKKRGKQIKVPIDPIKPIPAGPIDGPHPLDGPPMRPPRPLDLGPPIGPSNGLTWSIPIVEEKFTIVFI